MGFHTKIQKTSIQPLDISREGIAIDKRRVIRIEYKHEGHMFKFIWYRDKRQSDKAIRVWVIRESDTHYIGARFDRGSYRISQ